ncbi:MAG: hypothetical protein QF926_13995 [Alphaproteobacteria bacterium]|nr:hypothetical protein [Alphaproteobacteria bacterium]MDP6517713.1 hypothetical protein [Alphaproteobacteria bacterium]
MGKTLAVDATLYATGEAADFHKGAGLTLRRSSMVAAHADNDTASPLHLATYACSFVSHTITDATAPHLARVGVTGACLITDRVGDNLVTEWGRTPGESAGQWTVVRGSGKYAEATGGGTYTLEFLAPQPKPQLRFLLDGEIVTP